MDLRNLPEHLSSKQRIDQRRARIETELGLKLAATEPSETVIGESEKKNCEQMFGVVPMPVGYAGPLRVMFSSGQTKEIHLPLATTEGALVASVNRGCKAVGRSGVSVVRSEERGITRSIAFHATSSTVLDAAVHALRTREKEWKSAAEGTSRHLKVLGYDLDIVKQFIFLTIAADTDEAMGMNMVTVASDAVGAWAELAVKGLRCVTVAGNVDSDKKPSKRTHERGRGHEVTVSAAIDAAVIEDVLKTTADDMLLVAKAKLDHGSTVAGAIGRNLHAANVVAALYLATGQDAAHVVEGSLADTTVEKSGSGLLISVRLPAILVGVRGGGTVLPAQSQCLSMLLHEKTGLKPKKQLAESVAAAVLAGEVSLLAAQASGTLGSSHRSLAR